jgi:hypothetical protein
MRPNAGLIPLVASSAATTKSYSQYSPAACCRRWLPVDRVCFAKMKFQAAMKRTSDKPGVDRSAWLRSIGAPPFAGTWLLGIVCV